MASGRREPYAEAGPADRGVLDRHRPAVLLGDRLDHREAEPEATGVAGPTVVEPGEPVEHPLAVLGGDARPVVVDGELDGVGRRRRAARRPPSSWRGGPRCRGGCARRARAARGGRARARRTRGRCRRVPAAAAPCRPGPARRGRSRGACRRARSRRPRRGGRASSSSLTVSSIRASSASARSATDRPVGALGVPQRDLEVGADRSERAAQLVRRVGHELPLALRRRLEAVEHRVHRAGQAPDLVVGVGLRAPAGAWWRR